METSIQYVTPPDIEALCLPEYCLGDYLVYVWPHMLETMNRVVSANVVRDMQLQAADEDQLISSVGGYASFPGDAGTARKIFIELTSRLAEMPLNSENLARAHRLVNGISWARGCVLSYMDIEEGLWRQIGLDTVLGLDNRGEV